ncbi:hypothetical protein EON63_10280 [archaeon]|nr:MAG: hypothetical protein EON63_10280 [archaeon]
MYPLFMHDCTYTHTQTHAHIYICSHTHAHIRIYPHIHTFKYIHILTHQVSPLSKQRSFFSGGTGYHGIHNEPVDDGTYVRGMGPVQQDISLNSCMSRSGYPWGR